jgi:methenyltetrahydromethanopterin cyclohydrolase
MSATISLNGMTRALVQALLRDAALLRVGVSVSKAGATLIDAGISADGGLEAGRRIAEICMGGAGWIQFAHRSGPWPLAVHVTSANPVLACLGSQYAGWSLSHGEGKGSFHALGSGPARAIAQKEPLFSELGYRDHAQATCLVLEVDRIPPDEVIDKVAQSCGVPASDITLILTPTRSLAGMTQIVSRVLEVALHKAHTLHFPLTDIVDGTGFAPVPAPGKDFLESMGRSNDAILFGGEIQLFVKGEREAAEKLAQSLPSATSADYGRPFAEVFKAVNYDFYKIDPMLFAPASVMVTHLGSGATFRSGAVDLALLNKSFGA